MVIWYMNWILTSKLQSKCILDMKTTWKHRVESFLKKLMLFTGLFFHSLALYWAKQIIIFWMNGFWLTNLQLNSWSKGQVISKGNFGVCISSKKTIEFFKRISALASKTWFNQKQKIKGTSIFFWDHLTFRNYCKGSGPWTFPKTTPSNFFFAVIHHFSSFL